MRKKIMALLLLVMCIFTLAACGTNPEDVDYNGKSYEDLKTSAEQVWEALKTIEIEAAEDFVEQIDVMSEAERITVMEANEGLEEQYNLLKSWIEIQPQLGEFVEEGEFTASKSGKTTTTELKVQFENRPIVVSVIYNNRDMSVENTTVDMVYSVAEKMQKALLNTVMGMGTVFVMLIIISLIISCFAFIPKLEKKLQDRKKGQDVQEAVEKAVPVVMEEEAVDDLELVAVITAAIAATTGQSEDDFVVRSIRRR